MGDVEGEKMREVGEVIWEGTFEVVEGEVYILKVDEVGYGEGDRACEIVV